MKRGVEGFDTWGEFELVAGPEVSDDVHVRRGGTPLASSPDIGTIKLFVPHNISYLTTFSFADMKSILDPTFRYTKSVETDLRKTFARVRRELSKQRAALTTNVQPIRRDDLSIRVKAAR